MDGLLIGTVKENYDQKHPGMLQVTLPAFDDSGNSTAWLPVAMPYAGKNYGAYILPEKGDQVIVGFIGGNPHEGIVLGSLWNTKNTVPSGAATEENLVRSFTTKGGHSVVIKDGDEGGITVKSKAGHKIEIGEKDKKIIVTTSDGKNKIAVDEKGKSVGIEADDKISLKAKNINLDGKLTLKGQAITLEADNEVSVKGKQLKMEATTAALKGQSTEISGANVKVESSGILTLKGSMTKIN